MMKVSKTFRRIALGSMLGASASFVSAQALAAYTFYVSITGAKQGKFKGESTNARFKDRIAAVSFTMSVVSPRDAASGLASGKRQYKPLCIVKEWGASTPQIHQAAVSNEVLSDVSFDFVRSNPNGEEYIYQTIKLTNASISEIKAFSGNPQTAAPPTATGSEVKQLEEVCFTFQRIQIENKDARTVSTDDWTAR